MRSLLVELQYPWHDAIDAENCNSLHFQNIVYLCMDGNNVCVTCFAEKVKHSLTICKCSQLDFSL